MKNVTKYDLNIDFLKVNFSTLNLSLSLTLRMNMNRASFLQNIAYLAITLKHVLFRRMATETISQLSHGDFN